MDLFVVTLFTPNGGRWVIGVVDADHYSEAVNFLNEQVMMVYDVDHVYAFLLDDGYYSVSIRDERSIAQGTITPYALNALQSMREMDAKVFPLWITGE